MHTVSRLCMVSFLIFIQGILAIRKNVTIDDEFGDEITHIKALYLPQGATWNQGSNCTTCIHLNTSNVFRDTWHDITQYLTAETSKSIQFSFTGDAIYIFCVIPNRPYGPDVEVLSNYNFLIDDEIVGIYQHRQESDAPPFFYNTPVYVNETLENKPHNATIQVGLGADKLNVLLFDYAIYTANGDETKPTDTNETLPSSRASSNTAVSANKKTIIIGSVLGAFSLLLISTVVYCSVLRRHGRKDLESAAQAGKRQRLRPARLDPLIPTPFLTFGGPRGDTSTKSRLSEPVQAPLGDRSSNSSASPGVQSGDLSASNGVENDALHCIWRGDRPPSYSQAESERCCNM